MGALSKVAPLTRQKRGPLLLTPQAGGRGRLPLWTACIRRASGRLSTAMLYLRTTYTEIIIALQTMSLIPMPIVVTAPLVSRAVPMVRLVMGKATGSAAHMAAGSLAAKAAVAQSMMKRRACSRPNPEPSYCGGSEATSLHQRRARCRGRQAGPPLATATDVKQTPRDHAQQRRNLALTSPALP